ncbi:MAG: hypothetical protein M0P26_00250 [Bacteroidales bacterium]|nr:hypothetical protein [Bacteroidales bacterium]
MRKLINKAVIFALVAFLFSACTSDPELFDKSDIFVAFHDSEIKGTENSDSILVPVVVGALKGSPAITVSYEVELGTAVEGVDFTVENSSLSFTDGFGTQYIVIRPVDNSVFEGDKAFKIILTSNSVGYPFGSMSEVTVTLVDDEHPLKLVLGDYIFAGSDAWGDPFSVNITTSAVEGDLTQISFPLVDLIGYSAPAEDLVYASVDLTKNPKEFKIKIGQSFDTWGYGPCKIQGFKADETELSDGDYVTGTVDDSGNITMNEMLGVVITSGSYEGASFVIYGSGSIWTKQ